MPDKDKTTKQIVMDWVSQGVFDSLGDAVSIQDTDFKVLYQNQSHKKMIGEHIGEYCYKAYQRKVNLCEKCHLAISFKDGKVHKMEQVRDTDAGIFYYEIISSPLKDNAGKIIAGMEVVKDISKRKQAEKALATSEEKYRLLVNALQEGIWALDTEENTTFVNDRMAEMLGYTVEEMLGKKVFDFMDERGVKLCKEKMEKRKAGVKEQHDFELIKKDGSVLYVTMEASPIKDEDGNYIGGVAGVIDITERKNYEVQLKESENRFRGAFENVAFGAVMVNLKGRFFKVNQAFCRMLGYSEEEMLSKTFSDITHPNYIGIGEEAMKQLGSGKVDYLSFEKRYIRKDAKIIEVLVSPSLIRDDNRNPQFCLSLFQDITERREAEEKLRKSERQLAESQEVAKLGSWDLDLVLQTLDWSEQTYRLFDRTRENFVPSFNEFARLVHPDDLDMMQASWNNALKSDAAPYHVVVRIINDSGREWVMEAFGKVSRDEKGNPLSIFGTAQDITERKLVEEAIQESEERLRAVFNNANEGILIADNETKKFHFANKSICKMLGYGIGEITSLGIVDIHPAEDVPDEINNFEKLARGEISKVQNIPVKRKDGTVFFADISAAPLVLAGKQHLTGFFTDITERKKAEEELNKYRNYLEKLVKERTNELEKQKGFLEDKNVALREVIGQIELEKRIINENISNNIDELIIPILRRAKLTGIGEKQIDLIEQNLKKITSSFGVTLSSKKLKLTPREIDVCNMVEKGLSNKEMSDFLNISIQSIEGYRKNIRKKLGLSNKKVNLISYLRNLR